jgi:hypothetical protein
MKSYYLGLLIAVSCASCVAEEVHVLVRPKEGKTTFHLGEAITMEVACVGAVTQRYLSPCDVRLQAKPVSTGSRMSVDRINEMVLLDATCSGLPYAPRGVCGTIAARLPSEQSEKPVWQEFTLQEPFPSSIGQYKIAAALAFEAEIQENRGVSDTQSSSDEVEITIDDEFGWKSRLIQFPNCDYEEAVTVLPDNDAVSALRSHLNDCAVEDSESFSTVLQKIVWLELQLKRPSLYARIMQLEAGQPAAEGESNPIAHWFRDEYRALLLQTARQLVLAYKSQPELHRDEDFQDNLESSFENWHDAAASLCGGSDDYVSRVEVAGFLQEAGFSQKYIRAFLRNQKTNLPMMSLKDHR